MKTISERIKRLEANQHAGNQEARLYSAAQTGGIGEILTYLMNCKQTRRTFDDRQDLAWRKLIRLSNEGTTYAT